MRLGIRGFLANLLFIDPENRGISQRKAILFYMYYSQMCFLHQTCSTALHFRLRSPFWILLISLFTFSSPGTQSVHIKLLLHSKNMNETTNYLKKKYFRNEYKCFTIQISISRKQHKSRREYTISNLKFIKLQMKQRSICE